MDVQSAYEVAKKLRELAHMGDYGYTSSDIILELLAMAEDYQEVAQSLETQMLETV